jgi:hypothetical protein
MNYALAFFELGGGCVCSIALSASSNLIGASVSLSVFLVCFFFARFFTYSLSAPSGQVPMMLHKQIKLAGQPVPSNALPVSKPLSLGLFNSNFHAFPVGNPAIVPTERKLSGVAVQVFAAHMMERTHDATLDEGKEAFASVHMGNRAISILAGIFVSGVIHNVMPKELLLQSDERVMKGSVLEL